MNEWLYSYLVKNWKNKKIKTNIWIHNLTQTLENHFIYLITTR